MSRPREVLTIYANQVDVTSAPFICAILDRAVSRLDVYCLSGENGKSVIGCQALVGIVKCDLFERRAAPIIVPQNQELRPPSPLRGMELLIV